jgi:hypothetical protein
MVTRWMVGSLFVGWMAVSCGGSGGTGNGAGGALGGGGTTSSTGGSGGGGGAVACLASGTVLAVAASGATAYVIDGASNPDLTFCRGSTHSFSINAPGHPFYIKTVQGPGTDNAYDAGVTGNGTTTGMLVFTVPSDAPATLFYDCSLHAPMTGTIHVRD